MNICIITNIPSPYRIPLFERMNKYFAEHGWKLTVLFLTKTYTRRKWAVEEKTFNFHYQFLNERVINFRESFFTIGYSIPYALQTIKPDIVLLGGFSLPMLMAILYAKMHSIPFCLWSGETNLQSLIRKDLFHIRKLIRRWIILNASAAAVYGTAAKQYMIEMGMPPENIDIAINTVDTDFFKNHSAEYRLIKEDLKKQYHYPDINLLYVGHLTEQKGLQYLIKAIFNIKDFDHIAALHIVGSGPYEETLKSLQIDMSLKNIFFHGFRQKKELPFFYGICDIFVFPSLYDIWGLVCIEAMAAGLPVVCSKYSGISYDLINNYNSLIIDTRNIEKFAAKIQQLLNNPDLRKLLSKNASDSIADTFNLNRTSRSFVSIVNKFSKHHTC